MPLRYKILAFLLLGIVQASSKSKFSARSLEHPGVLESDFKILSDPVIMDRKSDTGTMALAEDNGTWYTYSQFGEDVSKIPFEHLEDDIHDNKQSAGFGYSDPSVTAEAYISTIASKRQTCGSDDTSLGTDFLEEDRITLQSEVQDRESSHYAQENFVDSHQASNYYELFPQEYTLPNSANGNRDSGLGDSIIVSDFDTEPYYSIRSRDSDPTSLNIDLLRSSLESVDLTSFATFLRDTDASPLARIYLTSFETFLRETEDSRPDRDILASAQREASQMALIKSTRPSNCACGPIMKLKSLAKKSRKY
ncbi:hypothetical protein ROZALSC1DRAFT_22737 [Rozella allomycis CSF55]|uniref:RGS domain-containing protein n=1 Tax=Rozella allomycis (strain CSF55) TaxID=988480 RepID=A0A4P9YHB3_ROZAC|nr:hypothetical protein ROZALSC1DRAFT_22737 [Rozella allomycis CSF55]